MVTALSPVPATTSAGTRGTGSDRPTRPRPVRRPRQRPEAFTVASYLGVGLFALFCIVPLWMILAGSFTDETVLSVRGYSLFPYPFSIDAYQDLLQGQRLFQAYRASVFITVVGTAISLTATAGLAWVIARRTRGLSRPLMVFAYIPLLFHAGLVPLYLLVTQYLQLRDNWFAVILPHAVTPFLVFIAVSYFRQLPLEIIEAAMIDGAGELRIFFSIVLPLAKPILAVLGLFYAVSYWNEWFLALLFITDSDMHPLQLALHNLIANVSNAADLPASTTETVAPVYQLRLALTVLTVVPILFAYPFAQRYFVKGLTLGATKN